MYSLILTAYFWIFRTSLSLMPAEAQAFEGQTLRPAVTLKFNEFLAYYPPKRYCCCK
jgi:hypothetical protein